MALHRLVFLNQRWAIPTPESESYLESTPFFDNLESESEPESRIFLKLESESESESSISLLLESEPESESEPDSRVLESVQDK